MCGIAGFWRAGGMTDEGKLRALVQQMTDTLIARGPDSAGVWVDRETGVALGHRRLAIIDLSPAGHQPMASSNDRYVISYNGEVYNFAALRSELEQIGCTFRSHSDTEVMLAACAEWGVQAATQRFVGMFAFALWDREARELYLVRDRLGIKPLYWYARGGLTMFASELKALRAHPGWEPHVNRAALAAFMRHNYIPAPHSIYADVHKLEPGCMLTIGESGEPRISRYWDALDVAEAGLAARGKCSDEELIEEFQTTMAEAVRARMVADVPLGAFLSGGVDSSAVVALMQGSSMQPVKTFSIGFRESGYDEAQYAKAVAQHLGTDHTELYVDPEHALGVIPALADMYDEPFADSSQIPTFLVSELTRQHVTVSLSGDGGDELFAGYNRYLHAVSLYRNTARLPAGLRQLAARLICTVPQHLWDLAFRAVPGRYRPPQAGHKMHKLAGVLCTSQGAIYRHLVSHWHEPDQLVLGAQEPKGVLWDEQLDQRIPDAVERMQYLDLMTYLPDDILTKVDRASMAVSLEARVPLLDHRLVELSWRLPMHLKMRGGTTKWVLRELLYKHVPKSLIDRPKMGFGVPLEHWLRGPLREWAETLLGRERLEQEGYFDAAPIRARWERHLSGAENWAYPLWNVLMFQAWKERWL
ncbi:MAG: asparagine synthase (glutamine-hydrolyzing) [Gammaproteobacteria bacterium]|jgi:asparagine synthase (glutamine-hydrolysing)